MRVKAELKSSIYFALKALTRSKVRQRYEWFRANELLPFGNLRETQADLLVRLCKHAVRTVPAHRERFEEAGLAHDLANDDLSRFSSLPLVTRYDLVNHGARFTRQDLDPRKFRYVKTGGSTGRPAQIGQDASFRDWSQASTLLFNSGVGLSLGMPYLFLWGAAQDLEVQRHRLADRMNMGFLQERHLLDATQVSPERLAWFIETINRRTQCHFLIGYANEVFNVACHSLENGLPIRPLRLVFTTAENLTSQMRDVIQRAFGCKVLNRYGSRDLGDVACECPHQRGLHVNPLFTRVEVADEVGRPLPFGREGQLVVTSLHNYVMPLIRYAIGDMGIMKPAERCECGRDWETIVQLTGRTSEVLELPDGSYSRGALLHMAFEDLPQLKRYQIHQLEPTRLLIKLRSAVPCYVTKYATELDATAHKVRLWTRCPFEIEFVQTERFDKTPTGKELAIVRKQSLA